MLRYRVSELIGREDFLLIGEGCAQIMEQQSREMGVELSQARRVLDFGCGCGRTLRWFLLNFPDVEFHGADVDAEAIAWCRQNLLGGRFVQANPLPPLSYPAGYFDVIYCLSVFTHLDEPAQDLWLRELARILAPGGLLLFSVHGARAAEVLDENGRTALRANGFVHQRTQKLKGIMPDWYQTSWHTERYIVERVSGLFDDVQYRDTSGGMQAFVLGRGKTTLNGKT